MCGVVLANLWRGPFVVVDGANAGTTVLPPSIRGHQHLLCTALLSRCLRGCLRSRLALDNPQKQAVAERRFRPEFRVGFHAWMATDPLHHPHAPGPGTSPAGQPPTWGVQLRRDGLGLAGG